MIARTPTLIERLANAVAAWRRQQRDHGHLLQMSDAELRDLGIGRGQIPSLLNERSECAPGPGASRNVSSGWTVLTRAEGFR